MTTTVDSTKTRAAVMGVVSTVVGIATAWFTTKLGGIHAAWLTLLAPTFTGVYYFVLGWLEKKFPKLLWLFGQLPQAPVAPTPAPVTPVVPPVVVASGTAPRKPGK